MTVNAIHQKNKSLSLIQVAMDDSVCSVPECPGDMTQDSIVKPMLALPRLALHVLCSLDAGTPCPLLPLNDGDHAATPSRTIQ